MTFFILFFSRIRVNLRIHDDIFSVMDTHMARLNSDNLGGMGPQSEAPVAHVEFFNPPVYGPQAVEM